MSVLERSLSAMLIRSNGKGSCCNCHFLVGSCDCGIEMEKANCVKRERGLKCE